MTFEMRDLLPILPELFVLSMGCILLLADAWYAHRWPALGYKIAQFTLVGAGILTVVVFPADTVLAFGDMFVSDHMGALLKLFVYMTTFVVFLYSREYLQLRSLFKGEYFALGLFAVLGMMILISAHNMITVYLGLELMSLCLYTMVAMQRDSSAAVEAAMKYFVLGALASGMLLYGMSMLYGATGTLDLAVMADRIIMGSPSDLVLTFGLVFTVAGIAFKLGAVPFHMWLPDVYHGAPTAVTLFISTAPKIAAFAMAMRLLVDGMGGLIHHWQDMLIMLSVLSLAVGNILAIAQTNLKRMLAYSTIAHIGFLLLGMMAGTRGGYSAAMFYILVYAIMSMGAFGLILLLSRAGFEADRLDDFKGLNERSPWFAFIALIIMFSMAGVPPFLGFWAKWMVLLEVVRVDMLWLAVLAVFFSFIGVFYYIRIVKLMYFDKPEDDTPLESSFDMRLMLSVNGLAIMTIGMFPRLLMGLCLAAISI